MDKKGKGDKPNIALKDQLRTMVLHRGAVLWHGSRNKVIKRPFWEAFEGLGIRRDGVGDKL